MIDVNARKELKKLAAPINVSFDKAAAYSNMELMGKLCDLKPVMIPVLKIVKVFTGDKTDKVIDQIIVNWEKLCSKTATDAERDDLFDKICDIYMVIKPILHVLSLIPTKVGAVIKLFMKIADAICMGRN